MFLRVVRWAFGGFGGGETPGPIPNPEVKPFSADGTAWETVWESRTPPDMTIEGGGPAVYRRGLSHLYGSDLGAPEKASQRMAAGSAVVKSDSMRERSHE